MMYTNMSQFQVCLCGKLRISWKSQSFARDIILVHLVKNHRILIIIGYQGNNFSQSSVFHINASAYLAESFLFFFSYQFIYVDWSIMWLIRLINLIILNCVQCAYSNSFYIFIYFVEEINSVLRNFIKYIYKIKK